MRGNLGFFLMGFGGFWGDFWGFWGVFGGFEVGFGVFWGVFDKKWAKIDRKWAKNGLKNTKFLTFYIYKPSKIPKFTLFISKIVKKVKYTSKTPPLYAKSLKNTESTLKNIVFMYKNRQKHHYSHFLWVKTLKKAEFGTKTTTTICKIAQKRHFCHQKHHYY
jgi:hypothetical protein